MDCFNLNSGGSDPGGQHFTFFDAPLEYSTSDANPCRSSDFDRHLVLDSYLGHGTPDDPSQLMTFYTGFYMRMQPEATWIEKLAQGLGLIPD